MKIRTQADIEKLEQVPVMERIRHASVADLLRDSTREHSDRVAIRYLAGTGPADAVRDVTFEQLMRHVLQSANLLQAHGIGPQDTVTLLMPSVPETFFPDIWPKVEAIRAAMPELRVFRVGGPLTDREQIDILQ
jgi:fatty-acyl-CoA synthase